MTQGRVALGDYSLRYADTGRSEPVFLCLQGLADTLEVWDALARPLAERGRLERIDQRGHGESGAPPGPARARISRAMRCACSTRSRRPSASRDSC